MGEVRLRAVLDLLICVVSIDIDYPERQIDIKFHGSEEKVG